MKFSVLPLVLPPLIFLVLVWGLHGLMTSRLDRFALWVIVFLAVGAGTLAIALRVWDVNARLQDLEDQIERLRDRIDRKPTE